MWSGHPDGATAHVFVSLTGCYCRSLPGDLSLPETGWLSTGRTVCVSTVSSQCLRAQRTFWVPAVSHLPLQHPSLIKTMAFAGTSERNVLFKKRSALFQMMKWFPPFRTYNCRTVGMKRVTPTCFQWKANEICLNSHHAGWFWCI